MKNTSPESLTLRGFSLLRLQKFGGNYFITFLNISVNHFYFETTSIKSRRKVICGHFQLNYSALTWILSCWFCPGHSIIERSGLFINTWIELTWRRITIINPNTILLFLVDTIEVIITKTISKNTCSIPLLQSEIAVPISKIDDDIDGITEVFDAIEGNRGNRWNLIILEASEDNC